MTEVILWIGAAGIVGLSLLWVYYAGKRVAAGLTPTYTVEPPKPAARPKTKILYGETCFAEYMPSNFDPKYDQPWRVCKYYTDWTFSLDREEDVIELMSRLDKFK